MNNEILENVVTEYFDVYNDKEKKFTKFNIFLPEHIRNRIMHCAEEVKQLRLAPSIFASVAISEYLEYVKQLYNNSDVDDDSECVEKVQTPFNLTDSTLVNLREIVKITGTADRTTAFRNAVEHMFSKSTKRDRDSHASN